LTLYIEPADWNASLEAYRSITISYTYTVKEEKSNWTGLQFTGSKTFGVDFNLVKLEGQTQETVSGRITGEKHNYELVRSGSSALVHTLWVKIDGGGGNDKNNIGFDADLNIHYTKKI
jgi:hypothetical protein